MPSCPRLFFRTRMKDCTLPTSSLVDYTAPASEQNPHTSLASGPRAWILGTSLLIPYNPGFRK